MLHGYMEINPDPASRETCEEFITRVRQKIGVEPLGCELTCKYSTETEFKVMCFFATSEGYDYALSAATLGDKADATLMFDNYEGKHCTHRLKDFVTQRRDPATANIDDYLRENLPKWP